MLLYSALSPFSLKALYNIVASIIIPISQQLRCPTGTHLLLGEQGKFFSREPEPGIEPATLRTAVRRFTQSDGLIYFTLHINH